MYMFRVTFESELNGKRKSVKVEARGMEPALTEGIHKFFMKNLHSLDWNLVKCEQISGRYEG
jgi:hypothetical protein